MEFKAYHKIRQFKDIVRDIQLNANFKGMGDDGEPIYQDSRKPILMFSGTVKLHGTNAGVCYTLAKGVVAQKRSSLIPADQLQAHFSFNQFVQVEKKDFFETLMAKLWAENCRDNQQITIHGEWAGLGIQKSVGISELPKNFYIFGVEMYDPETDTKIWLDLPNLESDDKVHLITDFKTWRLEIDFNSPALSQDILVEITESVEQKCPVANRRGIEGIGEGVVWTCFWKGVKYIFKVKGEKHSVSKVKKSASVDPEIIKSIYEFVDYACTPNRIEQGIQEVQATEKRHTPDLLRWVANDIITEETDTLVANNLEWKQVAREVSNRIRQYFFTKIDKL